LNKLFRLDKGFNYSRRLARPRRADHRWPFALQKNCDNVGCQAAALGSAIRKGPEAGPPTRDVFHTTGLSASEVKAARMTEVSPDITTEPRESALNDMNDPGNQLAHITHVLQLAVSGQDRGQTPQLLPMLLQHLSGSSQQRHLPLATGLQLLQLGAQALNLSAGNLQVHNPHFPASCSGALDTVCIHRCISVAVGTAGRLPGSKSSQSGYYWLARSRK